MLLKLPFEVMKTDGFISGRSFILHDLLPYNLLST